METLDEVNDISEEMKKLPTEVYSSLQAMALSNISLEEMKKIILAEIAKYNKDMNDTRPKKKIMDLSSHYIVQKDLSDDTEYEILDEGGYEDETDSILKRLEVFCYEKIIVTEDVASILIDKNPECFNGCSDLQIIDGKSTKGK